MKILFVCRANQGRSQLAEAIFNKMAGTEHRAISAGTKVIREDSNKEGETISDPNIIAVLKEIGIDASKNVRNQITTEMIEEADKIIVMSEPENTPEQLKQNNKAIFWEISDTYNESREFVRGIRNQLESRISDFIKTLD